LTLGTATSPPLSLLRQAAWSSAATATGLLASLGVIAIATRQLTQEELGSYYLALLAMTIGSGVADLGLRNSAVARLAAPQDDARTTGRFIWTVGTVSATVVALAAAIVWKRIAPSTGTKSSVLIGVLVLGNSLMLNAGAIQVALNRVREVSASLALTELFRFGLSALALRNGLGADGLIAAIAMARLVGIGLIFRSEPSLAVPVFRARGARDALRLSVPIYLHSLVSLATFRYADGLLARLLGPAGLSVYATAMQFPALLQRAFDSIRPVVLRHVATNSAKGRDGSIDSVRLLAAILSIAASTGILFGPPVFRIAFSAKFADSVPVLRILLAWSSVSLTNYYFVTSLTGRGEGRSVLAYSLPQLLLMVPVCWLLVPRWGAIGAAAAMLVTSVAGNLLGSSLVSAGIRSAGRLVWASGRSIIGVLAILVFSFTEQFPDWTALLAFALLVGWLLMCGAFSPGELRALVRIVSRCRQAAR